jgi:hypothetical protein
MPTGASSSGSRTTLTIILPLSLAAGFMIGGVGTLIYPPVGSWAGALVCAGRVDVQSDYYTTPSGGSGVQRRIGCVSGPAKGAALEDITMMTFGIAMLTYAALAFALLRGFAARWIRRRAVGRPAFADFDMEAGAAGPALPADLQTILARVAASLQQGEANVTVSGVTIDDGHDPAPAERLARLKQLREAGLIGGDEYAAKKAEILSHL